jgi:hypothetical protein
MRIFEQYSAHIIIGVVALGACISVVVVTYIAWLIPSRTITFKTGAQEVLLQATTTSIALPPVRIVTHIATPLEVRGIYMTSWAVGTPSFEEKMYQYVTGTDINTVVIDVKDYSGRIAFDMDDPLIKEIGSVEKRIPRIKEVIDRLHSMGIYVIGRVAVFQDSFIVKVKTAWAVHDKRNGALWKDSGGAYWADPSSRDMWNYVATIARHSYDIGFDEVNFDYIRFPSDGAIGSADFMKPASTTKADALKEFFVYIHHEMSSRGIPTSADVFGQTTSDKGDMGIGQLFENVLPYFDYICPMVYPSHYINGFLDFPKPAEHPYEIVLYEMKEAARVLLSSSDHGCRHLIWELYIHQTWSMYR